MNIAMIQINSCTFMKVWVSQYKFYEFEKMIGTGIACELVCCCSL